MKFHATKLADGKLKYSSTEAWRKSRMFDLAPGEYMVEIKPYRPGRSNKQNAYYWGVVVSLVYEGLRDQGYDDIKDNDDAHDFIKSMFFKTVIYSEEHDNLEVVKSTTKFSRSEFEERIENVRRWAFEFLGVTIPPPNSQSALDF